MRQWWGRLLFMHWPFAPSALRPLVPPHLSIDTYEGQAWVGVVPFAMWGVRPYLAPPVPGLSSFLELNVRTYVHHDGVPGVLFLSMDIDSSVAKWGARQFYFLPYYTAEMSLARNGQTIQYASRRTDSDAPAAAFEAAWSYGELLPPPEPDSLQFFLTERYCLYTEAREQLYRCHVSHQPWPLRSAHLSSHRSDVIEALGLPTPTGAPLLHYAEEIKVDIWPLTRVRQGTRDPLFEAAGATEQLG
jgi:uncharacterized protein